MRIAKFVPVVASAGLIVGCATVTTGTNDLVTIDTKPTGATCWLTTEEKQVAVINPTPGSLEVPKSQKDLTVRCELEGYLPTEGTIKSDFQEMTLGNILLGGIVGVVVDAASGAMTKYEDGVVVTMIPASFPTEGERDAFFDRTRDDFLAQYDRAVEKIKRNCGDEKSCEGKLKKAEKERDRKLADLEAKRQQAIITGTPEAIESGAVKTGG